MCIYIGLGRHMRALMHVHTQHTFMHAYKMTNVRPAYKTNLSEHHKHRMTVRKTEKSSRLPPKESESTVPCLAQSTSVSHMLFY